MCLYWFTWNNWSLLDGSYNRRWNPIINKFRTNRISSNCSFPMSYRTNCWVYNKKVLEKDKLTQFQLNIAHVRTVHKVQDRSVINIVFGSAWDYIDTWIYVVRSRCRTLKRSVVCHKLLHWRLWAAFVTVLCSVDNSVQIWVFVLCNLLVSYSGPCCRPVPCGTLHCQPLSLYEYFLSVSLVHVLHHSLCTQYKYVWLIDW